MSKRIVDDIDIEVIELCREISQEIMQALNYFQVSVYKNEVIEQINKMIQNLKIVVELFSDQNILEPFRDYDAEVINGIPCAVPGESNFSSRVLRLINGVESQIISRGNHLHSQQLKIQTKAKKKKKEILSICQYGSKNWSFFQKL